MDAIDEKDKMLLTEFPFKSHPRLTVDKYFLGDNPPNMQGLSIIQDLFEDLHMLR